MNKPQILCLDREHKLAFKRICMVAVVVLSLYSFTLQNEIWIWVFKIAIPVFAGYALYLDMLLDYESMKANIIHEYIETKKE